MRACNRDPAFQEPVQPAIGVARLPGSETDRTDHGSISWESVEEQDQDWLARATREVAELQDYWIRRDPGCQQEDNQLRHIGDNARSETEDTQALSTLHIAQHEWRKVLDGTNGFLMAMTDAMQNTYWGDPCEGKSGTMFRLYVQNVNGSPLDRRGGQFDTLCKVLKETQADVFLGQEHNLDSTQPQVRSILHATSSQHWERYRLNIATNSDTV
jgi:hypothetical protein